MASKLSNLTELLAAIQQRAVELGYSDSRRSLTSVLVASIEDSIQEVRNGVDPDTFQELTILNFLIRGAQASYSAEELREFVDSLKTEEQ